MRMNLLVMLPSSVQDSYIACNSFQQIALQQDILTNPRTINIHIAEIKRHHLYIVIIHQ